MTAPVTTYYDHPMLKRSVWSVDVPLYYFVGGAAGAAMTLGAALQLAHRYGPHRKLHRLSVQCHWIGIAGSTAGAALLIHDLGRPARFIYMLRVFRPTSPMNMGAWILAGAAPASIATGLLIERRGTAGLMGEIAGYISGVFGAALATYTGVLVANSVMPIWQDAGPWMPVLFSASAAATAASVLEFLGESKEARRITLLFGTAGRLAELAAAKQVERLASRVPKAGEPFHQGLPGLLWKAAGVLTLAGLVLSHWPGKRGRRIGGVAGAAGSLCLRFAVHYLSDASARDPEAVIEQQRASLAHGG